MSIRAEGRANIESRRITRLVLAFVTLIFILGTALLSQVGIILLPLLAASLASLFVLDSGRHRILSLGMTVIALSVDFILNSYVSFTCLCALLVALLVARWFVLDGSKGMCVGISTLIISIFIIGYVFLAAFYELHSFDLTLVGEYIRKTVLETRESLHTALASFVTQGENGETVRLLSDSVISAALDEYINLLPAFVAITAFVLVGFSFKLFTLILDRIIMKGRLAIGSTFRTPALFAYFYMILMILQLFETDGSILSIALTNLHAFFMVVYAYVGFRFASFFLGRRLRSPFVASVIIIILALLLSSFSLQILSVVGTLETIAVARLEARSNDENENNGTGG